MRILIGVNALGEFEVDGPDLAMIKVNVDWLLEMRKVCGNLMSMDGFYAIEFFDHVVTPVDSHTASECDWYDQDWEPWDESWRSVPEGIEVPESDNHIECPTVRIKGDGVMWLFMQKHGSAEFQTKLVPWLDIEQGSREAPNA